MKTKLQKTAAQRKALNDARRARYREVNGLTRAECMDKTNKIAAYLAKIYGGTKERTIVLALSAYLAHHDKEGRLYYPAQDPKRLAKIGIVW